MGSEKSPSLRCKLLTEINIPSARVYKFKNKSIVANDLLSFTSIFLTSNTNLFAVKSQHIVLLLSTKKYLNILGTYNDIIILIEVDHSQDSKFKILLLQEA